MKVITHEEFSKLIEDVLCEEFELIGLHTFYLEVLTNEDQFFSTLIQYPIKAGIFNASFIFDKEKDLDRLIEEGVATRTYYLYDNLAEAHEHALTLLRNRDGA